MNIPNLLTVFRIVGSFVFLFFGLKGDLGHAFPVFCLAAFTDMVDGSIARILRQRTRLGAVLDPMADKLLMLFSFLVLAQNHGIPLLLVALVIGRDLLIVSGIGLLKLKRVTIIFRPTYLSKATTFFQILTIFMGMLRLINFMHAGQIFYDIRGNIFWNAILAVTGLLTVATAVHYCWIGARLLKHETTQTDRQ